MSKPCGLSPDVTVTVAAEVVLPRPSAHECRCSLDPGNAVRGALFDLGADYLAIGPPKVSLRPMVLDGQDPAKIPVDNVMPVKLEVNRLALAGLATAGSCPTPCCSGPTPSSTNRAGT